MQNSGNVRERPERLLPFREVAARTCLSKSEIYRRIEAGRFPKNIKLGARAVAWRESEIDGWIRALVQQQCPESEGGSNG
ncbi:MULTISPECIES: helix-turn-helix transcriptional regulator [Paraburkholderia]|uniref:helix-turn-helix transcriptional regulator n=1 Tax=Paraburkholderia TaxID=1822464 RepID=UPI0032181583